MLADRRCSLTQEIFVLKEGIHFFDYGCTSALPKLAAEEMRKFAEYYSKYGPYTYNDNLSNELEVRNHIIRLIGGGSPSELALLKNTSEAIAIVANGIDWKSGDIVLFLEKEFPSNRTIWEILSRKGILTAKSIDAKNANPDYLLIEAIEKYKPRLLALSSVQYYDGYVHDINLVAEYCKKYNTLLLIDAAQHIGTYWHENLYNLADFIVFPSHKWLMGPEGVGFLLVKSTSDHLLDTKEIGWRSMSAPLEFDNRNCTLAKGAARFECGTMNRVGLYTLLASLKILNRFGAEFISKIAKKNSDHLYSLLEGNNEIDIVTPRDRDRRHSIISFKPKNKSSQELHRQLTSLGMLTSLRGEAIRVSIHFHHGYAEIEEFHMTLHELTKR